MTAKIRIIPRIEQRKEKFNQAMRLLKEGHDLLKEAGFKLIFDSYNDDGVYAVPDQVAFDDWMKGDTDAGEFLNDCPRVIEVDGLYNDGSRGATDIPSWWTDWKDCPEQ